MKKISGLVIVLCLSFYLVFIAGSVFAASTSTDPGVVASVAAVKAAPKVSLTYPWSNLRDPSALVSQLFTIALGIVGASALGVLIYGAVLWTVSGAISSKQDAIEWIQGAVWGLVLLLGSYLILFTVNPDLVKLKTPAELMGPVNTDVLATFKNQYSPTMNLAEDVARTELSQANIGVKSVCPAGQELNCVNLNGIRQDTLNEIADLASQVGSSNVYITAGTEGCGTIHKTGEQSHCTGYKVDLRLNTALTKYIQNNFQEVVPVNSTSAAPKYISPSGAVFVLENNAAYGSHWDVLVKS